MNNALELIKTLQPNTTLPQFIHNTFNSNREMSRAVDEMLSYIIDNKINPINNITFSRDSAKFFDDNKAVKIIQNMYPSSKIRATDIQAQYEQYWPQLNETFNFEEFPLICYVPWMVSAGMMVPNQWVVEGLKVLGIVDEAVKVAKLMNEEELEEEFNKIRMVFINPLLIDCDYAKEKEISPEIPMNKYPMFILSHELRHVKQYESGLLKQDEQNFIWKGQRISKGWVAGLYGDAYRNLPHEEDANTAAHKIVTTILKDENDNIDS